jgi:hypothetical protein
VQLRFILPDDFRNASSTAAQWKPEREGLGHTSTINNCVDVGMEITQNRSSVSRPLPIVMEHGCYHVMNRGIDGRRLFPDNKANEHFR